MSNILDLIYFVNLCKPSLDILVFLVIKPPIRQVRHFVVKQEVSNRKLLANHEARTILSQQLIELSYSSKHLLKETIFVLRIQGTLCENCPQIHPDGSEHCWPKIPHVPRYILVNSCPLFYGLTLKKTNAWIEFTQIVHDSRTLSQCKIAVLQNWYLARRIHGSVFLTSLILSHNVDINELAWDLSHVDESLSSPSRLAAKCPVKLEPRHCLISIISKALLSCLSTLNLFRLFRGY